MMVQPVMTEPYYEEGQEDDEGTLVVEEMEEGYRGNYTL